MATTPATSAKGLPARIAAEKRRAAENRQLKTRVACSWTLAKTMLPGAPAGEQYRFAKSLLANSTPALKHALRQTAVHAFHTRLAEAFKEVHKVDLNDLLENPSVLSKEKSAVESEMKGAPKDASAKVADDRKECDVQPAKYDEGKRSEPSDLDADKTQGGEELNKPGAKEAAKAGAKKAHGKDCKGCPECDKKKEAAKRQASSCGADCKGCPECEGEKKEAAKRKKAEDGEAAPPPPVEADAESDAETGEAAEADADAAEAEDDAAQADSDAADAETESAEADAAGDAEPFDEEKETIKDAIEDVKDANDRLEDAISDLIDGEDESAMPEIEGGAPEAEAEFEFDGEGAGAEAGEGEELDLEDIFNADNMTDKVSALNDEGRELDLASMDDFFAPSDASELEGALDQEEKLFSPAEMFEVEGLDSDPLARLFASAKEASDGVVEPGGLDSHFETELAGDDRDSMSDHSDDIFVEVLDSFKQPEREDHRDKEAEPDLKEPGKAAAAAPKKARGLRTLHPIPNKAASSVDLARLLFNDGFDD